MNASKEAKRLRRVCQVSGRVDVEQVLQLLGLEIDERQFRGRKVDEIAVGSSVGVADRLSEPERRWAIAHAIGHAILHSKGNQVWLRACTGFGGKLEQQAEEFAYKLLVDFNEARRKGLQTSQELADYFGAPPDRIWMQGRLI